MATRHIPKKTTKRNHPGARQIEFRRCDRCGRITDTKEGENALFPLGERFPDAIRDMSAFCEPCIDNHSIADWIGWLRKHDAISEQQSVELLAALPSEA